MLDLVYAAAILAAAALAYALGADHSMQRAASVASDPFWYPTILLAAIAACAVYMAVQAGLATMPSTAPPATRWLRLGLCVVLSLLYLVAYHGVGFVISTLVMIPLMGWSLGYWRPLVLALVTIGYTAVVWYAFHFLLHIMLPGVGLPTAGF